MYDRTIVQGAIFNMRGQLYRGNANATALFSSPVVSALVRALVLAGARRCTLKTCGKKNASPAFRLGLIYILLLFLQNVAFWLTAH